MDLFLPDFLDFGHSENIDSNPVYVGINLQ